MEEILLVFAEKYDFGRRCRSKGKKFPAFKLIGFCFKNGIDGFKLALWPTSKEYLYRKLKKDRDLFEQS